MTHARATARRGTVTRTTGARVFPAGVCIAGAMLAAAVFAWVPAAAATPRAPVQVSPDAVAALEAARADARGDFTAPAAATAAYQRLERLREPLLASGDPRVAIWYADAAEDALVVGLAADDAGLNALAGLRTAAARERTGALLRQALAWVQRADECARNELAQGGTSPAFIERLDAVERARRIPLLRSAAAVMAARVGALPADDVRPVVESARTRLDALLPGLAGPARSLGALALGMACAQLGDEANAQVALAPIAADAQADPGARVVAMVLLAETSSGAASERRRTLASLGARFGGELDDSSRLAIGDADFRLASEAGAQGSPTTPPWQGWLDAVAATPPSRAPAMRIAALERIAVNATDGEHAVVLLARATRDARTAETRERAAQQLAGALASHALPANLRPLAEFELGRNELLLGRAHDGAVRLLRFAQEHPADPLSRHAIDATVVAARALGDPALFATVLATAVQRFPDHPSHAAWRIEAAALDLSPDAAPLAQRDPAPRRFARAIEALDRADRTRGADPALVADLVIAAAQAANDMGHADDALAVLDRLEPALAAAAPGSPAVLPADLRARLLEERITALALAARSIESDAWVRAEQAAGAETVADACARVTHRQTPLGLAPGLLHPPGADAQSRMVRLANATLRLAPPSPDRDDVVVCALLLGGQREAALPVARRAHAARGDRADAMLALAEALFATGDQTALGEAMGIYTRLAQSAEDGAPVWWVAELRRLQILDRVNRNVSVIGPRIARLRAAHPELGSALFQAEFLALAAKHH